jgi:hypothetical protein
VNFLRRMINQPDRDAATAVSVWNSLDAGRSHFELAQDLGLTEKRVIDLEQLYIAQHPHTVNDQMMKRLFPRYQTERRYQRLIAEEAQGPKRMTLANRLRQERTFLLG